MNNGWQAARDEGARLLDERDYAGAVEQLLAAVQGDPGGDSHRLLGLAYFQQAKYLEAESHYAKSLEKDPHDKDTQEMHNLAKSNALARVDVFVPKEYHFQRDKLLAAPDVDADDFPKALPLPPRPGRLTRYYRCLGFLLGWIISLVMGALTHLWGSLFGYRDRIWTNWYRRGSTSAILTLAYMREELNKNNLKVTYPDGSLIGFQPPGQTPPEGASHFRTADGSWNNLKDPKEGAAGTRFPRNVADKAIKPEKGDDLMSPNPREISRKLLARRHPMREVPFLNLLAACWIQFENHDWINHGDNFPDESGTIKVPLADDDPYRRRYRQKELLIGKTQSDPTYGTKPEKTPVTFINEVTHWWDASQIYGSNRETQHRLRSHVDGKLTVTEDGKLPVAANGVEDTGFVRNWWVGLSLLHTLFVREHNAICDRLKSRYPHWDDSRLFNVARLINAAVLAKIHSVEWTPAILPNSVLSRALNANWYGLLTNLLRSDKHLKTVADINVRNPEMGGVVGNPINKHDAAYGLTQEFVEIYRLHSLLPETLNLRRLTARDQVETVPLPATRQAGSPALTARYSMPDLLYSFGVQQPGQLVLNNFPSFLQEMSVPGNPLVDMGVIDILRARERGVPRYNEFRRQLGLNPIASFQDLTDSHDDLVKLKEVYGDGPEAVERLDLLIGTLSEGFRPTGFGFGETMFQIFILNATRRLQSDRFFTDDYDEAHYTEEGLDWIDDTDFKTVLLRNYPQLADTGLNNIKNAFEPWDTDEQLDPARHPLRGFDKALQPNPWRGNSYK
jgi:tetratricopeptide (TPR) repeat protein